MAQLCLQTSGVGAVARTGAALCGIEFSLATLLWLN